MTEPNARVILDSISDKGFRLTTIEVTLHRFCLAEINTHRKFSRNSESSRAVPVEKKLDRFINDPAFPVFWAQERPGMSAAEELEGQDLIDAMYLFEDIQKSTAALIQTYLKTHPEKGNRLHKSLLNRPLEWALYQTCIISSTEWDNFWNQRISEQAQPELMAAAIAMKEAYDASTPQFVPWQGGWHLPYVNDIEKATLDIEVCKKLSVARCARVSFLNQNSSDINKDLEVYDKMLEATPVPHLSPFEHVAKPSSLYYTPGNFDGWSQLRHEPHIQKILLDKLRDI